MFLANVFTDAVDTEQESRLSRVKDDIADTNCGQVQAICFADGRRGAIWLRRHVGQLSTQVLSAE